MLWTPSTDLPCSASPSATHQAFRVSFLGERGEGGGVFSMTGERFDMLLDVTWDWSPTAAPLSFVNHQQQLER